MVSPTDKREAILAAALDVFSETGFAASRLDDVARKAGVAKGTLYLYFSDKEQLFEELLLSAAGPVLHRLRNIVMHEKRPANEVLADFLLFIQRELLNSGRERILRLMITEGSRFPRIVEFYHREIVSVGRELIAEIARRGAEAGTMPSDIFARFPQLFFAPVITTVVWNSLFSKLDALDSKAMFEAYCQAMLHVTKDPRHDRD